MTNNLIYTSFQLKNEIGEDFEFVKKLDPISFERGKTENIKKNLIREFGKKCALCKSSELIDAAHIVPLEVGSTTSNENIILLCQYHHKLYDSGFMSINDMTIISDLWRKDKLRFDANHMFQKRKNENGTFSSSKTPEGISEIINDAVTCNSKRWHGRAYRILKKELCKKDLNEAEKSFLLIKCAEALRRRDAKDVLIKSLNMINEVNGNLLPKKYLPVFNYEKIFINRLNGLHDEALNIANESIEDIIEKGDTAKQSLEYVAALAMKLLCELSKINKAEFLNSKKEYFIRNFNLLETKAEKIGGYWGGRWAINCATHRLQVYIKSNDERGLKEMDALEKLYYNSHINNGWASGSIQSISLLKGLTKVIFLNEFGENEMGIQLLARSFVSRFSSKQRFEGIRDAGFGLAIGLKKLKVKNDLSERIKRIMNKTVDGTSYIWPYNISPPAGNFAI